MGKIKILKKVRKQILKESEIATDDVAYFGGWDHATDNALRIIDMQIKKLEEAKKSKSEWDKIPMAFKDYYNDDPGKPYGVKKSYKTFEDLDFKTWADDLDLKVGEATGCLTLIRAGLEFDNGYGVSVVEEGGHHWPDDLYELAVLKDGSICYSSGITEDVFRFQNSDEVTKIMKKIQDLKK